MIRLRKRSNYIIGSSLILFSCFIYTAFSIRSFSKKYFETTSDVAIVLGAGTANGKISRVYEERILHAIWLLKNKKVKKIILTGGYGEGQTISDAKAAKNHMTKKGIPENKILIEEKSTITFYNIKNAKDIMGKYNLKTALVVSDPYHMKRSMHMCNLIGIKALSSPTPTTMYRSRNTKFSFLMRETWNYWAYLLIGQHRKLT